MLKGILVVSIFFLGHFTFGATEEVKGYRLVRTSPNEFHKALYSPLPLGKIPREKIDSVSRMSKFFRVKSKQIDNPRVTLEVIPEIPLMGSFFGKTNSITVILDMVSERAGNFLYDVGLKSNAEINAKMLVEPHPAGSLMTITVKEDTLNKVERALIYNTIFGLGFLSRKADTLN